MSVQEQTPTDHWTADSYNASASFVHKLTSKILTLLSPQPSDHILDLGCGDGPLTSQIANSSASVVGLDSSGNFITHASKAYASQSNLTFLKQDCAHLDAFASAPEHAGKFDKVFSNAALHWILRAVDRRAPTIRAVHTLLKPGGKFVFEMGGAGNVAEVHAALVYGLVRAGISVEEASEAGPWYFPGEEAMRGLLVGAGFGVERLEIEYRPTRLEEGEGGGVEGWVRLMGASMLEKVDERQREGLVKEITGVLKSICGRPDGEGGEWLGYVRLRGVARKSSNAERGGG